MLIDLLNYLVAVSAIFFGYKIYTCRKTGKKFSEIKPLVISFGASIILLWALTIFTAYF